MGKHVPCKNAVWLEAARARTVGDDTNRLKYPVGLRGAEVPSYTGGDGAGRHLKLGRVVLGRTHTFSVAAFDRLTSTV